MFQTKIRLRPLKIIIDCFKSFCLKTTIHGFNHITASRRHWMERILWTFITAAAFWGAVSVSLGQWQRYNDNPTVVTLEKDFRTWRFSLPAVTTCDKNRVSPTKLLKAITSRWNVTENDTRYTYYSRFVSVVANSDIFHLGAYEEFRDDQTLEVDLLRLAVEVMPEQHVKTSSSEAITAKWTPVMTENGPCYATNTIALQDIAITKPDSNLTRHFPFTCHYSATICYIIFEVTAPVHFYVHSPYDVADCTDHPSTIYPSLNRFTELSVIETKAGPGVRDLSRKRRACLYTDENPEHKKQVYSTHMCRLSCRSRLAMKLCGCRPFYYFFEVGPQCDVAGMWCLSQYVRELANFEGFQCSCSQQCVDSAFLENFVTDQFWGKGPFQGRGALRLTVPAPRTRFTREIVFHFQDLVVSFGGAAGLFLGASFISFVEIIYFLLATTFTIITIKDVKKTKPKKHCKGRLQERDAYIQYN